MVIAMVMMMLNTPEITVNRPIKLHIHLRQGRLNDGKMMTLMNMALLRVFWTANTNTNTNTHDQALAESLLATEATELPVISSV